MRKYFDAKARLRKPGFLRSGKSDYKKLNCPLLPIKNILLSKLSYQAKQELRCEEKPKARRNSSLSRINTSVSCVRRQKNKSSLHRYLENTQFFSTLGDKKKIKRKSISYSGALALCINSEPTQPSLNYEITTVKPVQSPCLLYTSPSPRDS